MNADGVTRESWKSDTRQREDLCAALARELSKIGTLEHESQTLLALGQVLDTAQVVALYEYLRDESKRDEAEWRDEFEELFPEHADALPPIEAGPAAEPEAKKLTPYQTAKQLIASGAGREAIRDALMKQGLDAEAIDVLLRAFSS